MSEKTLLYFTDSYPGDIYSEKVFVDGELDGLLKSFNRIILLPRNKISRRHNFFKMLPKGVEVDWTLTDSRISHSRIAKLRWIFHPLFMNSLVKVTSEAADLKSWVHGLYQALDTVEIKRLIKHVLNEYELSKTRTYLYSLWFHNTASACALLGREGWNVATRAHTSDLYDDRHVFRSRQLRSKLLAGISHVFTISQKGADYMKNRYPKHAAKISCIYLGSRRIFKPNSITHSNSIKKLSFMTVARLDPIKRLPLIVKTLDRLAQIIPDRTIEWTLIGDGEEKNAIEKAVRNIDSQNLKIKMMGAMNNVDIQKIYSTNPPDWYIMMSQSEGLPISMGEAMSYGIPVMTTSVGDIGELISPECSVILDADNIEKTVRRIQDAVMDPEMRRKMGEAALRRWESFFNSEVNSLRLGQLIAEGK